jgi:hypothetical protein
MEQGIDLQRNTVVRCIGFPLHTDPLASHSKTQVLGRTESIFLKELNDSRKTQAITEYPGRWFLSAEPSPFQKIVHETAYSNSSFYSLGRISRQSFNLCLMWSALYDALAGLK